MKMAKRFTDTEKYKKPFIRGLQGAYKLFWDYLYHDCDHAGIWIVDFEIAQLYLGSDMKVNESDALKFFNEDEVRVIPFSCGKKWFIKPFIEFQYGELNPDNRVHKSVINILKKENLYSENKGLTNTLQGCKDKDKDKDMDKDISPLIENFKNIQKMEEPLTIEQGENLIKEYGKRKVEETLMAMENWKPLLKKNKSANLTAQTWMKRDMKAQTSNVIDGGTF